MSRASIAGARCVTGGLIGAAGGILLAAVPPAVARAGRGWSWRNT